MWYIRGIPSLGGYKIEFQIKLKVIVIRVDSVKNYNSCLSYHNTEKKQLRRRVKIVIFLKGILTMAEGRNCKQFPKAWFKKVTKFDSNACFSFLKQYKRG